MFGLFNNKTIELGSIVGNDGRELMANRRKNELIIYVKANEYDLHCINNYYGKHDVECQFKYHVYSVHEEYSLGHSNYKLESYYDLIHKYLYGFTVRHNMINSYSDFLKTGILLYIYIEPVEYHSNGQTYLFKNE